MQQCNDLGTMISAYVDGELPIYEEEALLKHVKICQICLKELDDTVALKRVLVMPKEFDVSANLAQRLQKTAMEFAEIYSDGNLKDRPKYLKKQLSMSALDQFRATLSKKLISAVAVGLVMLVSTTTLYWEMAYRSTATSNGVTMDTISRGPDINEQAADENSLFLKLLSEKIDIEPEKLGFKGLQVVRDVDEARERLSYVFPVPVDTNEHKLEAFYIQNKDVLYAQFQDGIVVAYNRASSNLGSGSESYAIPLGAIETKVRGQRALAMDNNKGAFSKTSTTRHLRSLSWHENGLNITIYSAQGATVEELKRIAESME